jgi:hypothetical protein
MGKHTKNFQWFFFVEFPSKKSATKLSDFGIVNIVQEATPILSDDQPIQSYSNEEQTATQHLAEQTSQILDDIRK